MARRKKERRRINAVAEDASSLDSHATSAMLDNYFRDDEVEDKKPRQYSLLVSLVIVFIALYIVFPALQEPLDIEAEQVSDTYEPAGGSAGPPPSKKVEQEKKIIKEKVEVPTIYQDIEDIELVIDQEAAEANTSSDWDSMSVEGRIGGTDFGIGDGGVGPYIQAGPGGLVPHPELLKRVEPDYPDAARKARVDGFVLLEAIVNQKGNVVDIRVLQAPPNKYGFAEKAKEAVSQWLFKPSIYKGRPVSVKIRFSVEFNLLS